MFGYIAEHQLDIMLALCAVCATIVLLLFFTKYLTQKRKQILMVMELIATLLLASDRAAYIYKGDTSQWGSFMVRLSNFMVFFLTSAIVLVFDLYLDELLNGSGSKKRAPRRLKGAAVVAVIGMAMSVVSHFTGLYYYIDENSIYHRGSGFLLCYVVPVVCPLVLFTVILQNRRRFSRLIFTSLVLYILVPVLVGILQIFTYGLSLVNMAMVLVSVFLYVFSYLDINAAAEMAHEKEVNSLQKEQRSMKRLFEQTVSAFVAAIEKRDSYAEGHSVRVAALAREIAETSGRSAEECEEVYYAGLLHDVGMMGIPDELLRKTEDLTDSEMRIKKRKPIISGEILESISEYPYLSTAARHCGEWYDGSGFPDGLKGDAIPETARIIAVADACDTMISGKRSHSPMSVQVVREEFVKMSGSQFDPEFADIMVAIIDRHIAEDHADITDEDTVIECGRYREQVSAGIAVTEEVTKVTFDLENTDTSGEGFSAPSLIVFDAYDRHIHTDSKTIEAYRYTEFGELWFDGHYISTAARNVSVEKNERAAGGYEITAGRYEDHLLVEMRSPKGTVRVTVALPDNSRCSYIGLTGENCRLTSIKTEKTGKVMEEGDIGKIVERIVYTDRLESDLPNIQTDHTRSVSTEGVLIEDSLHIDMHTMSLPAAELVWHCPYVVIFYSDDKQVFGENYREYALIKLNGEIVSGDGIENIFKMKKTEDFAGWDEWKRRNKEGVECSVGIVRKGGRVILRTENLGISIENTTILPAGAGKVYAALTGDQTAITDIRINS